jgi:leader peptidase (prepilin peptidase) / N-methyltransferase
MAELLLGILVGAALGSLAGVALTRWSTGGTLADPRRSCCLDCGSRLRIRDNIPVLSWLILRGRCRECGHRIDPRLLIMELACAAFGALVIGIGLHPATAVVLGLAGCGAVLATATDLEQRIIPDRLTIPLALVILPVSVAASLIQSEGTGDAFLAALRSVAMPALIVPGALVGMNRVARRLRGVLLIGGGDIKLLVGLLAAVAILPRGMMIFGVASVVTGGAIAIVGVLTGLLQMKDRLPFAPVLLASLILTVASADPRARASVWMQWV